MTRTLRARHRRAVLALGVVLPAGIAIALAARPAPLPAAALGIPALAATPAPASPLWAGRGGDVALSIVAHLVRADDAIVALDLAVRSDVGQPDTLAYWSTAPGAAAALPHDAILLGPVDFQRPERFALPAAAHDTAGTLVLYRIAQGSVAAALPLPATGALTTPGASS